MTQTVLIGDVADINSESVGKNYPHNEILYLDTSSVTENIFSELQPFNTKDAPSRAKRIVRDGDIVYSTVRPNLRHFGYIQNPAENTVASTGFAVIRAKEDIESRYLYYWLASDERTAYLTAIADSQTSTFPAFNPSVLGKLKIELPDLETQKRIANILGTIDEKIELNRRMNETLEQMGQALFRHYFIDNPEAEKWDKVPLSELCEKVASGGTPATKREDYYGGDVQWYSTKELKDAFLFGSEKTITGEGLGNSAAKLFPENTVVMAIYAAPTVGRLGILTSEASFNQATCGLVAKPKIGYEFIYLYLLLSRVELNNMANGAAQQNISVGKVRDFKVMSPDNDTILDFRKNIEPIFSQIKSNSGQIQALTTLRDTLLPRLISGRVRV